MSFHPLFSYAGIRWFLCIFWYHPNPAKSNCSGYSFL